MKQKTHDATQILLGLCLVMIAISQGCAAIKPKSQFLDNKIVLKQCKEDRSKLWWERPGFNWHNYNEIMLDPIVLKIDQTDVKTEELQTAVTSFREIIAEELRPEYTLVNKPGPKVLRIHPTITDISTSNPAVNLVTTLALFVPLDMGGATIEVDFLNSTGERVAAMIDQKTGTPLQLTSAFSRFGHAKHAVKAWAKELKTALAVNP